MSTGYSPLRRWLREERVRQAEEQRRADIPIRRAHNGCVCDAGPCFRFPCVSSTVADGQALPADHPLNDPAFFRLRLPVEPDPPLMVSPDVYAALTEGTPLPPEPTEFYDGKFFFEVDEPGTWSTVPSEPLTAEHLQASIKDMQAIARGEVKVHMPVPDPVPPWRAPKG